MSNVTIAQPDPLDAAVRERMAEVGAHSKEEYLLALIESGCATSELERILVDRLSGPFETLETVLERTRAPVSDEIAVRLERHPAVLTEEGRLD